MASDPRFEFSDAPQREKLINKQPLFGSEFISVLPLCGITMPDQPQCMDFIFPENAVLLPGPNTYFQIALAFEKRTKNTTGDWSPTTATDKSKIVLQTNWFEKLLRNIELYIDNRQVRLHDQPNYVDAYLNTFLYHTMHPTLKRQLAPESCNPIYATAELTTEWADGADEWNEYAKKVLKTGGIVFSYTPLMMWPFFQGPKHTMFNSPHPPNAVPLGALGRVMIRFNFRESYDHVFKTKENNADDYRINFAEMGMRLHCEVARMSNSMEKSFLNTRGPLPYVGITKIAHVTRMPDNNPNYTIRIPNVYIPDAVLVFALPKEVISGEDSFNAQERSVGFTKHKIKRLMVLFNGDQFIQKGVIPAERTNYYRKIAYCQHINFPICGIPIDESKVKLENMIEESTNTNFLYPHIYYRLDPGYGLKGSPIESLASTLSQRGDLDINMEFEGKGSSADAVYVLLAIYEDCNLYLEPKSGRVYNRYLPD